MITLKLVTLGLLFLHSIDTIAQQPHTEWIQRYNSPGNFNEDLIDMALDKNGNIYLTGNSGQPSDIVTLKYDNQGNLLWTKFYDGSANHGDKAVKIAVDDSGFVYVAGNSTDPLESSNYLTIKYDKYGNTIWERELQNGDSTTDISQDMILDDSSNILISGYGYQCAKCFADYLTVKYDRNGNLIWKRFYHGEGYFSNLGWALTQDNLGRIIVTGRSADANNNTITATIIYNANGDLLNAMKCDSTYVTKIITDSTNNIYIGGYQRTNQVHNVHDIFANKYDNDGILNWRISYNSPNALMNHNEYLSDMKLDAANKNIYLTGRGDYNNTAGWEYLILKYNIHGDTVWQKGFSPIASSSNSAESMTIDTLSNVYITGYSDYNTPYNRFLTVKYDSAGQLFWFTNYSAHLLSNHIAKKVLLDKNNSVLVAGTSFGLQSGTNDIVLVKYSQMVSINPNSNGIVRNFSLLQNYPNPFNNNTIINYSISYPSDIKLVVYNILGKEVKVLVNDFLENGIYEFKFNAGNLPTGVYFYSLFSDGNLIDKKKSILIK